MGIERDLGVSLNIPSKILNVVAIAIPLKIHSFSKYLGGCRDIACSKAIW